MSDDHANGNIETKTLLREVIKKKKKKDEYIFKKKKIQPREWRDRILVLKYLMAGFNSQFGTTAQGNKGRGYPLVN